MAEHDSKIRGLGCDDSEEATHGGSANFATMNSRGGLLVLSLVLLRGAVACSDTPLSSPASDGNYDDEGAPGNMNDPSGDDASTVAHDSAADVASDVAVEAGVEGGVEAGVDASADVAVDAPLDAEADAAADGSDDANPDADPDAAD
jgi:hypothetical protein